MRKRNSQPTPPPITLKSATQTSFLFTPLLTHSLPLFNNMSSDSNSSTIKTLAPLLASASLGALLGVGLSQSSKLSSAEPKVIDGVSTGGMDGHFKDGRSKGKKPRHTRTPHTHTHIHSLSFSSQFGPIIFLGGKRREAPHG